MIDTGSLVHLIDTVINLAQTIDIGLLLLYLSIVLNEVGQYQLSFLAYVANCYVVRRRVKRFSAASAMF